jgi:hypothetical protein
VNPIIYGYLADAVVVFHFAFVAFVMAGGLLALRWRRVMWLHLPAVAWGIYIELSHGICPLTPLENHLRRMGGEAGYQGGFVDHYIMPVLYPEGLTEGMQVALACLIILINVTCYGVMLYLFLKSRRTEALPATEGRPLELTDAGEFAGMGDPAAAEAEADATPSALARSSDKAAAV